MASQKRFRVFLKQRAGLLLNILIFVLIFIAVSVFQTRNMLPASGTMAPGLDGPLLHGGYYAFDAAVDRPMLVYFFAPWCKFCAASSDNLTRLRRLRDADSLEILTVALDWQDREEVLEYVERHELDLPVLLGDKRIAQDWHVFAFPAYYVLDSNRQIRHRDLGYSTLFGLWWRTFIVDLGRPS